MESLLIQLIEQMREQTDAINRLAVSNLALVDALTSGLSNDDLDESEDDEAPTYLDGSR